MPTTGWPVQPANTFILLPTGYLYARRTASQQDTHGIPPVHDNAINTTEQAALSAPVALTSTAGYGPLSDAGWGELVGASITQGFPLDVWVNECQMTQHVLAFDVSSLTEAQIRGATLQVSEAFGDAGGVGGFPIGDDPLVLNPVRYRFGPIEPAPEYFQTVEGQSWTWQDPFTVLQDDFLSMAPVSSMETITGPLALSEFSDMNLYVVEGFPGCPAKALVFVLTAVVDSTVAGGLLTQYGYPWMATLFFMAGITVAGFSLTYDLRLCVPEAGPYAMPTPGPQLDPRAINPQFYSYGPRAATSAGRNKAVFS